MFNVTVNGTQVLTNFDIYAQASNAEFKAVAESFSATADNSGKITVEFAPVTGYAQINGLEVQSGGSDVLAVNAGLLPGGTITVEPSTFTNQGSLQASNGGTLALDGAWSSALGATITANGGTLDLGDQYSSSANVWSNAGTITATNSTVNLGGLFTLADLGTFNRTGGMVNLVGTLDNTGTTLALNATTGSWNLSGGILENGSYTAAGGAELVGTSSGGTLNNVAVGGNLDFASNYDARAFVENGLTLSNERHDRSGQRRRHDLRRAIF